MTQTTAAQATDMALDKTAIRPFQVSFPDAELADLRRRINATRWSYHLIARVFDGGTEGLTRDDILDNITLYWLTNTGVSSARLY